jgi:hypothetical protein
MSRWVYLLGLGLTLLALAFVLTEALLWEPGITEANVRRIREGMTLAEVETILGNPGRCCVRRNCSCGDVALGERHKWLASGHYVRVIWDVDGVEVGSVICRNGGQVLYAFFDLSRSPRPSPLARLRAWLGG